MVSTLGDSSITVSLRVWVKTADYWDVMFMFNEQSRDRLKAQALIFRFRSELFVWFRKGQRISIVLALTVK